ncbi:peptidylprolyl isomerase [Flammeovirga yaeyamensis]|uniref:peptidylprolyl isomerase n=1 Tax=Flammeovirga yaeyamensis TaxID=367791 RepID=A0AAX1N1V0_9BACT|nr:peptidylprolyl isomerase [Flammeovirga yaeyamensis]MBB3698163.1 peptidyl-prolyl cis-trans isomerase B (cyclophilin B) [Flammeovirga yaeyamensis]NMF34480.1 peptidylprolyl isomerase [Flammeovirga yaeyamensis]QWG01459.1 peptidylprolyl isomerase [Flammeovirga yaeyamensis]
MLRKSQLQILLLLLGIFILGCESKKSDKFQEQEYVKKKVVKRTMPELNDDNAIEELTWYGEENQDSIVLLSTRLGDIKIKLYKDTWRHRSSFIMLTKRGYFNNSEFYRVVPQFIAQGGDTDDPKFRKKKRSFGKYHLPNEIYPQKHIHKRGAVAAAREYDNNPKRESTPFDFFIVQGYPVTDNELAASEQENGVKYNAQQRKIYKKIGGTPHLDGMHTVFGEVIEGMDVVDKICAEKTEGEWPLEIVTIQAKTVIN